MKVLIVMILMFFGTSFAQDSWVPLSLENYFDDWRIYIEDSGKPYKCEGDFDGDNMLDTAWLVFDAEKQIRVAVKLSSKKQSSLLPEKTFAQYMGSRDGIDKEGSWFALQTTKKGQYETYDGVINLKSDAITIIKFESSAQAVYWVNGVQKSFWLGD